MATKKYISPIIHLGLEPTEDPEIDFGYSQGTSGFDSMWSFEGISQDDLDMIELNCDDLDLADMDLNGDYIITADEFDAWLTARGGW